MAGYTGVNTGVVVRAILEQSEKPCGKFLPIITEYMSMTRLLEAWEKVTGKSAIYCETSDESFGKLLGPWGTEVAGQLTFSEQLPYWDNLLTGVTVTVDQLKVRGQLVGLEEALDTLNSGGIKGIF